MPYDQTIIIGAGVLGLSTAAELSQRGHSVIVIDYPEVHRLASGRSFSWLNSFGITTPAYHRLRLEGLKRYRALLPQAEDWLAFPGSINLIADPARAERLIEHHASTGYPVERLSATEVMALEPAIDAAALRPFQLLGALDEGWVDLPPYLAILREHIRAADGRFITDRGSALSAKAGRIRGVTLSDGSRIEADAVLVAAGAATPALLEQAGFALPDRTNHGLVVRLEPTPSALLRHVLRTPAIAVRPLADGGLVLHSDEADKQVGRCGDDWVVSRSVIESLIDEAAGLFKSGPKLTLSGYGVGSRPIPADRFAVVGAVPGTAGLFTAFTHSAATLGPAIGELLAGEIAGEGPNPLLKDFRPNRFVAVAGNGAAPLGYDA